MALDLIFARWAGVSQGRGGGECSRQREADAKALRHESACWELQVILSASPQGPEDGQTKSTGSFFFFN